MKQIKLLIGITLAVITMTSCMDKDVCCSTTSLFNDEWLFFRVDSSMQISENQLIQGVFPAQAEEVSLPHTSRIEPLVVNDQWQGICYYSKFFEIPGNNEGESFYLKFEGAMNVADIWVNGVHIKTHLGGFLPFVVNISPAVKYNSRNVVVVKLDNTDNPITGPKPLKQLDFNTYGGIYRNVWLITKSSVHITDPIYANKTGGGGLFIETKNITENSAMIDIKTNIANDDKKAKNITLVHTLLDKNKKEIWNKSIDNLIGSNDDKDVEVQAIISRPHLWSPDTPYLYRLKTELYVNGQLVDQETNSIGIREITILDTGLYLNGKKTLLRGVNRHQEYPHVGYALSDAAQYRDAYLIKKGGFDYVRASHYPPSPAFLKACDELGIFVLDAIPGWQYFGDSLFVEYAKTSARELIRRDRNHPCVLAWELSINETPMPKRFMEEMNDIRTEEAEGTYTAGWIKGGYDIYIEARQHRTNVDATVPFIVSEYGDWEYYAQNAGFNQNEWNNLLAEERTSRQPRESGEKRMLQQVQNIQEAHNDNLTTNALADGYWSMFDYNRGYADDMEYSGVMDIFRLPKFSYYFFQSQRSIDDNNEFAKPMMHIASYWKPESSKSVKIYSNCDEVELYLNNYFIARKCPDNSYSTVNIPHPPFTFDVSCTAPGILKAYGYYKGKKVCSDSIRTAGEAARINIWADTCGVSPKTNDLIIIHAQIEDETGTLVDNATQTIEFQLKGNGAIVKDKYVKAIGGIASVLLKTGNNPGEIVIEAKSSKLSEGVCKITL